eukprot:6344368-Pyramimonas_sp.AAC.1
MPIRAAIDLKHAREDTRVVLDEQPGHRKCPQREVSRAASTHRVLRGRQDKGIGGIAEPTSSGCS